MWPGRRDLDDDVAEEERSSYQLSALVRAGLARTPSGFDLGRYRRLPADSSSPAWLLGLAGLVVPVFSVVGVWSALRAWKLRNRLAPAAATWCVLTAVTSIVLWAPVLTGPPSTPGPLSIAVIQVGTDATPPPGLGFASVQRPTHYAELDVIVTNDTDEDTPLVPSLVEVRDGSDRTLAWATTDQEFLATSSLAAHAEIGAHLFVALPSGAAMATIGLGEAQVELSPGSANQATSSVAEGRDPGALGQGDRRWTVLADPEGNEFCVLGARS